ncbi:serine/arginine repetitive matrix protein 1 [Drosophila kikkawai]|uniref:Serine/arginine repetitive matrix protein 1 n=1 Tax=Drosophila kikkawai TaxID=30033 RepID=A0A6P4I4M6_DROKI|nr:pollen-specific leucine-rich repeat extensin-like protein 1 [Drosophila kikkawai]
MKPESNYNDETASGDAAHPIIEASSTGDAHPMATSTPGRMTTRMITKQNIKISPSSSPAIGNNKEQSPSTSPPTALTPTLNTASVANTSLPQRVPRSLQHIKGRCPVRTSSLEGARSPRGRPKKQVLKTQMTKSPKAEPESPKAEALKTKSESSKNATPKEQSPSTSPPAVVTPTTNTTGVANTSLAQRVPRSLRHIKGRCPVRTCSVEVARSPKEGPKNEVPKTQMTKSPKPEPEYPNVKSESPKAEAKASPTPKPEPDGTSRSQKRQHSPEDAISEQASTSAKATRANAEISPSPPLPYQLYQVNMHNCPVGLLILNSDQQIEPNGVTAANQSLENPFRFTEPTPAVIAINALETPPVENPYRSTTEPIPKTKNYCLIM